MWKYYLPPSVTSQDPYFRQYVQMAEGTVDGVNLTTQDCGDIEIQSKYRLYNCINITDVDLYVKDDGTYSQIYLRAWQCVRYPDC